MVNQELKANRILSIDIMRGLTLFLMLFVNDLFISNVPEWMVHTKAGFDGMGLADWVFPGFLFMVGMSISYAISSRMQKGMSKMQIFGHIILRTISLLVIGVLMINSERLNSELSGISKNVWTILMYVSVFLIWNKYPENKKLKKFFLSLKILGIIGIIVLLILFKAGESPHVTWLKTGWWGILGLIGWGYFVVATVFLMLGSKLLPTMLLWVFFIGMSILSQLGMLEFLNFPNPVFGVIIEGNVPSIVLAGLVVGLIIKESPLTPEKTAATLFLLGFLSLIAGFLLRNWFIISKIMGTPSWAMICNGISIIIFSIVFLIVDTQGKNKWAFVFQSAGQNSLTTYLVPDVVYFIVWGLNLPLFFYKQESSQLLAVCGSLCWALSMIGFSVLLSRINIRLKL